MAAPTGGISGVAVGMIGAGVVLIVSAVTGQTITSVLRQAVGLEPAQAVHPATPSSSGKSGLTPGPDGGNSGGGGGGGGGGTF